MTKTEFEEKFKEVVHDCFDGDKCYDLLLDSWIARAIKDIKSHKFAIENVSHIGGEFNEKEQECRLRIYFKDRPKDNARYEFRFLDFFLSKKICKLLEEKSKCFG
jgi:hypothetical protein